MAYYIYTFLNYLLLILWLAVFARALLSWFDPTARNPLSRLLWQITEPILAPIRQLLPASSIDFSPLIAIVIIGILQRVLASVLTG